MFSISVEGERVYYLGQSDLQGGYSGNWFGVGDFIMESIDQPLSNALALVLTSNTSASQIVVSASTVHGNQNLQPYKAFNNDASGGFILNVLMVAAAGYKWTWVKPNLSPVTPSAAETMH